MKKLFIALFALAFSAAALIDSAEAARLGGGRSLGTQRQLTTPPRQATPPTQQQQPAAAQPGGASRWLGPLAGLAAGLGLGWLFAQGGFGPVAGALLMALLAGGIVFALMRLLTRQGTTTARAEYTGFGNGTAAAPTPSRFSGDSGAQPPERDPAGSGIPAGFDTEGFLKEAKRNFLRLQEANDRNDLELLREVTSGEMFDALKGDLVGRQGTQQTDLVTLNASLLQVTTEGAMHWASVRFSGSIREDAKSAAGPFEEIWHLQKPADGSSGWLLAGIQQLS